MSNLLSKYDYDGIGYISNRGKSKYWGVSVCSAPHKDWMISITDSYGLSKTFYFRGVNPCEETCARIAFQLSSYDGVFPHRPFPIYPSDGSTWVVDPRHNTVVLNKAAYKKSPIEIPSITLPPKSSSWSQEEIDFVKDLTDMKLDYPESTIWEIVEKIAKM